MKIIYCGSHAAVEIPDARKTAERGKPLELPRQIAEQLLAQRDADGCAWKRAAKERD